MSTLAINSLDILKRLKSVGFTEQQAETHAQIFTEVVEEHLITKKDLEITRKDLDSSIKDVRTSVNELEYRLTIKMGTMLVAAVSILAILMKLL